MTIRYRFAELSDSKLIWNWRNEESVRCFSRNHALIPKHEHELWFAKRIRDIAKQPIFIFSNEKTDIGFTRLDTQELPSGLSEISIVVVPEMRSKGFGSIMLRATIDFARTMSGVMEIIATIREDNQSSLNLFMSSGFYAFKQEPGFICMKFSLLE